VPGWNSWYWNRSSLWMSANIGSWWWSSWCSPSWYYYGSSSYWYDGWCYNWCRPRHRISTCWWWPTTCYYPTYYYGYDPGYDYQPSYVTVVQNLPAAGSGEVAASAPAPVRAEMTPQELAQKYVGLGDFYFSESRFSEAADAYARARTYAPEDPSILFVLADATFATGDYHYAAYLIGEALRMDPGMARVEADKRLLYKDVKVFETQVKTLERYLVEKPYDAMARLVLGYNLKFSGRNAEAIKAFERTLEVDPESSAAKIFLTALTEPAAAPVKDAEKKDAEKKDAEKSDH
jgi:tetratricopeptide (TPR) repeat protein